MKNKCCVKEVILNPFFYKMSEENSLTADASMCFTECSSPTRLNDEEVMSVCNYSNNVYLMTSYSKVISTLSSFSRKSESTPMQMRSLFASLRGNSKLPARAITQDEGTVDLGEVSNLLHLMAHFV